MDQTLPARPTVVITGASTGIGEASALELGRRGFRVFAGVRREADAQRLKARSPDIAPLLLDVTDAGQIAAAAEAVGRAVGDAGLAGLVNNAGIVVAGPLEILPLDRLRSQFEVNVVGQIAVTQAFLPLLRKGRGRIVNMSSLNGRIASPYLAPYAASKHALEAVNNAMRVEFRAWGIRVVGDRARRDDDADLGQIDCRRRCLDQQCRHRVVQGRPGCHAAGDAEAGRMRPCRSIRSCAASSMP